MLPLETQIKDHKQQLQSRLDNLAKINEKTTSINEQMAMLKAVEADLQKQRDMIEGLIARVSAQEARAPIPDMVGIAPCRAGADRHARDDADHASSRRRSHRRRDAQRRRPRRAAPRAGSPASEAAARSRAA